MLGLGFMETFGGTSKARVSLSPLLLRVVEDIEVDIAQGRGRHHKVAPPLLPSILVSMEKVVCDEGEKKYVRVFAWYQLVRVWGSMRFNDTLHVVPEDVHFKNEALVITVCQQDDWPGEEGRALVCHHLRLRVHRRRQLA